MSNSPLTTPQEQLISAREAYVAPVLTLLGDVRDLTLGGSPGSGDSGNPGAERF
jgi:hypothetical protein